MNIDPQLWADRVFVLALMMNGFVNLAGDDLTRGKITSNLGTGACECEILLDGYRYTVTVTGPDDV